MLGPARAAGGKDRYPARNRARTRNLTPALAPARARLVVMPGPPPPAPGPPSAMLRMVLPVLLLAVVSAATLAALPLLTAVRYDDAIAVATPQEAVTMGLASGRAVRLSANVDDARRVRAPQRGATAWYAPVTGDGTALLVRTDDPERLRSRPLAMTGKVTTLGALGANARTIAALRDARGQTVTAQTPVLVEQHLIATALLTGLALLVAWGTAIGAIWLLRWEAAPAARSAAGRARQPAHRPALRDEPLPGA